MPARGPGNPGPVSACPTSQGTPPAVWYNDCTGQEMPRSPKLSGSVDYSHTFRLASGAGVVAGATAQFSDAYWAAVDYNPLQRQKQYVKWDADVGYHGVDDKWSLTMWGANLFDEVVFTNAFMLSGVEQHHQLHLIHAAGGATHLWCALRGEILSTAGRGNSEAGKPGLFFRGVGLSPACCGIPVSAGRRWFSGSSASAPPAPSSGRSLALSGMVPKILPLISSVDPSGSIELMLINTLLSAP
jgi:hypothetical protein